MTAIIYVMKVSKTQAAENRAGIVDAAARLYREKGLSGVGVAEITRDAGLTHGGLYRHFASKDALAREACLRAFEWTIMPLDGLEQDSDASSAARLQAMVDSYLSTSHRDHPGEGCPAAALRTFCERIGVGKSDSIIDMSVLEDCVREELDGSAPRAMRVVTAAAPDRSTSLRSSAAAPERIAPPPM